MNPKNGLDQYKPLVKFAILNFQNVNLSTFEQRLNAISEICVSKKEEMLTFQEVVNFLVQGII